MRRLLLVAVLLVGGVGCAHPIVHERPSMDPVALDSVLKPGDQVRLRLVDGRETRGIVQEVDADRLVIDGVAYPTSQIASLDRFRPTHSRPWLWTGVLVALALGAARAIQR